ncbi:MAG: hypothetical protein HIU57_01315 [Acidobacteria bacterium]|nr:hypothetical protein [Acidobacteriota bacterium]
MDDALSPPAYYARPRFLGRGALRDWWSVLHPPYTLLHLSLVTLGACLSGPVNLARLGATVAAFFLAVGIGAHCLDELHGRPLGTRLPNWQLVAAAIVGLGGAVALGVVGVFVVGGWLAAFIVVGVVVAVGYNLELFGARLHHRTVVVVSWGAFPIVTAYYAQHHNLSVASLLAAGYGAMVTLAQQQLSTPARELRRRTSSVEGVAYRLDGSRVAIDAETILAPLENTLKTLCRGGPLLALALLVARVVHR